MSNSIYLDLPCDTGLFAILAYLSENKRFKRLKVHFQLVHLFRRAIQHNLKCQLLEAMPTKNKLVNQAMCSSHQRHSDAAIMDSFPLHLNISYVCFPEEPFTHCKEILFCAADLF